MSNVDVVLYCATLSAAATALLALLQSGLWRLSYGLTAFLGVWVVSDSLLLWWPQSLWTPELCGARESALALLCVLTALELGRSVLRPAALVWKRVCWRAAWLLLVLVAVGVFGRMTLAGVQRVGYRGLVVVDGAAAGVLALVLSGIALYELPRHALVVTALRGLLRFLAVQVLYLGAWEASRGLAHIVGVAASAVFVWSMLGIAREGLSKSKTPRPILTTARVTK